MSEQLKGHGHVTPNADGFLARCGGPSICKVCKAELAALKAQEPVAWEVYYADDDSFHTITRNKMLIDGYSSMAYVIKPLYAAPVSEAKAQGVRLPPRMWEDPDAESPEFARGHNAALVYVERLNATPVQQVSVPDGWKLAPVEPTHEMLGAALMNQVECLDAIEVIRTDYKAMLAAAPAPGGE